MQVLRRSYPPVLHFHILHSCCFRTIILHSCCFRRIILHPCYASEELFYILAMFQDNYFYILAMFHDNYFTYLLCFRTIILHSWYVLGQFYILAMFRDNYFTFWLCFRTIFLLQDNASLSHRKTRSEKYSS